MKWVMLSPLAAEEVNKAINVKLNYTVLLFNAKPHTSNPIGKWDAYFQSRWKGKI